jgi:hypothetical protein
MLENDSGDRNLCILKLKIVVYWIIKYDYKLSLVFKNCYFHSIKIVFLNF